MSSSQPPTKGAPTVAPIQPFQNPISQTLRHAVPALQAGLFAWQFGPLVADPVTTMLASLPVIAATQLAYAALCLPPAGSSTAKPARKTRSGEKKKAAVTDGVPPNAPVASLLSLLLTTFSIPFLYVAFVCFGAPAYTYVSHTALCAAHLAVLTLFPLFYVHGVDGAAWADIGAFKAPVDETVGGLVGGFVGAWLGAVPIPLDWDREWQRWPVTILAGVYGGYLAGRVLGGTVGFGRRFS
ncbi:hypothetical protein OQA88_3407 [Cercophora sp. LCS_1]